jgi:tetratricopeptide (TPR) repeat protein
MPQPENGVDVPGSKPSLGERLSAAMRRVPGLPAESNRRTAVIGLVAAASVLPLVVGLALWFATSSRRAAAAQAPTVADARKAFDAADYERARWLSLALGNSPHVPVKDRFWPPLLLGRLAARNAEQSFGNDQIRQSALAARYFAQAARRGLPEDERGPCLLQWGKSLYVAGQPAESAKILQQALSGHDEHGANIAEARLLLAKALTEQDKPDLPAALVQLDVLLKPATLPLHQHDRALAMAAEIEFRSGHLPQAIARLDALGKVEAARPDVQLLRGQILAGQAAALNKAAAAKPPAEQAAHWKAALAALQTVSADAVASDATRAAAGYLVGVCYQGLGQPRAAAEAWTDVHHRHPFAAATVAARFELAEQRHRDGNDDQAATLFHEVSQQIEDEEAENPWLGHDEARQRVFRTHQRLLEQHKFALAMELGKWFEMLFTEDERVQLTAQTHEAWGRRLQEQADALPAAEARGSQERAREERLMAGDDYRRLAQLRFTTREYGQLIWLSAENYAAGHAYAEAVAQWRAYLDIELRLRRGEALLELGRALLTLGDPEEALLSLDDCIELEPASVASFEARRLSAEAYLELQDPAKAQAVLEQTLNSEVLKPVSQEWRQALMALARLLYQSGRLPEARVRLEEVVRRYPDAPFTIEARYLLATTCWKLALAASAAAGEADAPGAAEAAVAANSSAKSPAAAPSLTPTPAPELAPTPAPDAAPATAAGAEPALPEAAPVEPVQTVAVPPANQLLTTAVSQYASVAETLARRQEESPLPVWDAALLRNSYFGQGAVLYRQGRYEQAIQAYLAVVNRYYAAPEVLEAYAQIYACYRRLGKATEARDALLLARAALDQLPADAPFDETTNHSRQQWRELFDTFAKL